jgi:hypothetical protein
MSFGRGSFGRVGGQDGLKSQVDGLELRLSAIEALLANQTHSSSIHSNAFDERNSSEDDEDILEVEAEMANLLLDIRHSGPKQ